MKLFGFFKEEDTSNIGGCPSINDYIYTEKQENADEIIRFLLNAGHLEFGSTANSNDILTGEDTGMRQYVRSDGEYMWPIDLVYYIENHNLHIPEDFERHILS